MTRRLHPLVAVCVLAGFLPGPARAQHLPVYIEDSPAAQEMIDQARGLQDQGRASEAVATLQRVIDEYHTKLMPIGEGLHLDAGHWVRQQIEADAPLLEVYRQAYTAQCERDLRAALKPPMDVPALERLLSRYYLTRPALEAGLSLAGIYLERANLAGAQSVLNELRDHPDLESAQARYESLAAAAALLRGDNAALEQHRERLGELSATRELAEIDALREQLHPPLRLHRRDAAEAATLPAVDDLSAPLWTVPIGTPNHSQRQYSGQDAEQFPSLATAAGDRLYVNHPNGVVALDRFSGRLLWQFEQPQEAATSPLVARMARAANDRRGVLARGDRVVAVVGQASLWPMNAGAGSDATSLVCLRASDGQTIWRVRPTEVDPSFERAYFQGTPVAAHDRLMVFVRRNQSSGFQDTFVVALDFASGRTLWKRHVSSAVTASRFATTAPPQMLLEGGTLYACDNLAAVAAISTRDGSLRWAYVVPAPPETGTRGFASGGDSRVDAAPPVLLRAGLVVPPTAVTGDMMVLDPATGRRRYTFPPGLARGTDYVLRVGADLLCVGRSVVLLDGGTLEKKWEATMDERRVASSMGFASVTDQYILVPGGSRVAVLDRTTGKPVEDALILGSGNVLALDGQVVVADASSVRGYIGWDRAYTALATQVEREPTNPAPGLAMAHLALTSGRSDEVLIGVDHALDAVANAAGELPAADAEALQRQAFEQLLDFADPSRTTDVAVRQALFERLASTAASAQQEVAYHLAYGQLLTDTRQFEDAVEHYQAVLLDPTLASQLFRHHDTVRQAGLEAQRRLSDLVTQEGREVYARFNAEAAAQLAEINARPIPDAEALMRLAAVYPMSDAAPLALYHAAEVLVSQGRTREALGQLRQAYERAIDRPVAAQVAGRLVELYQSEQRPRQAMHWLRRLSREHPQLQPIRNGQPVMVDAWLSELAALDAPRGSNPSLVLPLGRPFALEGELMPIVAATSDEPRGDRLLTRLNRQLRFYSGPELTLQWEVAQPADDIELLSMSDDQLLLWSGSEGRLVSLDADTGDQAWPDLAASELLAPLGDAAAREAGRPQEQRDFLQMIDVGGPIVVRGGQVVIERPQVEAGYERAVGDTVICVADRIGGIVGVDRQTGRVLWQKALPIDRMTRLEVAGDTVAVAGISGLGTDAMSGVVQVLDLLTGEERLPMIEDKDPPQWVGFVGDPDAPLLLVATADQVTAHRLSGGEVVWRIHVPGLPLTGAGWTSAELALLATNGDGLLVLRAATGEIVNRLSIRGYLGRAVAAPVAIDEQWQILTPDYAAAISPDGLVAWRDAVANDGYRRLQQLVGDPYVVLLTGAEHVRALPQIDGRPVAIPNDGEPIVGSYRLHVLERATGSVVAEYDLSTPPASLNPSGGLFLENHLAFPAGDRVIVVPGKR